MGVHRGSVVNIELLYLAWNRLEMTKTSFRLLKANTNWSLVDRLVVYDDGSTDGTAEYLEEAGAAIGVPAFYFRRTKFRSPTAIMNDAFARSEADVIAKIDNDIAVPPAWLDITAGIMGASPELQALGMEAARTGVFGGDAEAYSWIQGSHMGGVGLIRTSAITKPLPSMGRYGWTEYQHRHRLMCGWVTPDLPVVQLDLIPEEPWLSLADYYVSKKWARRWPSYDPLRPEWWRWVPKPKVAA